MDAIAEKETPGGPFPRREYAARQRLVRERTAERGLDGLLIADPANLFYLTGYNAWSFYMPQLLYVPVDGEPLLMMREMDANGAYRTAVGIGRDRILGYPESLIHQRDAHPGEWMAKQLLDAGPGAGLRVGYEGEAHFLTPRLLGSLSRALSGWALTDCNDLVNWVRVVKSDAEIELMRAAGKVCGAVMRAGLAALAPGRPQHEVAAEILAAQARGTDGVDGDYPAIVPLLPTGAGADTPHLTWSAAPLPVGEPISLEIAGAHHRYHAPLARTAIIGRMRLPPPLIM